MRGSPLFQCLVGALAFALFAVPLTRLTLARPPVTRARPPTPAQVTAAESRHAIIRIHFAHPPKKLSLQQGGRELLPAQGTPFSSPMEAGVSLPFDRESLELNLAARWPDGTPKTALTIEVEPDEFDARSQTRWSSGPALDSILTFQW